MLRPRWHDALIAGAIVALFVAGVWALWGPRWEDVVHPGAQNGSAVEPVAHANPQT